MNLSYLTFVLLIFLLLQLLIRFLRSIFSGFNDKWNFIGS